MFTVAHRSISREAEHKRRQSLWCELMAELAEEVSEAAKIEL
jgi:hypothetical protein